MEKNLFNVFLLVAPHLEWEELKKLRETCVTLKYVTVREQQNREKRDLFNVFDLVATYFDWATLKTLQSTCITLYYIANHEQKRREKQSLIGLRRKEKVIGYYGKRAYPHPTLLGAEKLPEDALRALAADRCQFHFWQKFDYAFVSKMFRCGMLNTTQVEFLQTVHCSLFGRIAWEGGVEYLSDIWDAGMRPKTAGDYTLAFIVCQRQNSFLLDETRALGLFESKVNICAIFGAMRRLGGYISSLIETLSKYGSYNLLDGWEDLPRYISYQGHADIVSLVKDWSYVAKDAMCISELCHMTFDRKFSLQLRDAKICPCTALIYCFGDWTFLPLCDEHIRKVLVSSKIPPMEITRALHTEKRYNVLIDFVLAQLEKEHSDFRQWVDFLQIGEGELEELAVLSGKKTQSTSRAQIIVDDINTLEVSLKRKREEQTSYREELIKLLKVKIIQKYNKRRFL